MTLLTLLQVNSHLVILCILTFFSYMMNKSIIPLVLEEVHPKRSRLTLLIFVTAHSHLVHLCILTCWINLLFTNILCVLCCFSCKPQSTRHLKQGSKSSVLWEKINFFGVGGGGGGLRFDYQFNWKCRSKCACTLVTGTHKCFNIFTPSSQCAVYPSFYPYCHYCYLLS